MLTKIRIENYRCFDQFEFSPGLFNLILGANGAGKSSMLDHPRVIDLLAASHGHWFERDGTGAVRVRAIAENGGLPISTLVERGWVDE